MSLAAWCRGCAPPRMRQQEASRNKRPILARAWFTEPNIVLEIESYAGDHAVIRVDLDLEFRAPSNKPDYRAGNPTVLGIRATAQQLSQAADALEADVKRYPDEPDVS